MKDPENGFWENRDEATVLKDREMLLALPTGVLDIAPEPAAYITAAGEKLYFKMQSKWIDDPSGEGRLLLSSAENITELLAQQQRIQDQASILENQTEELAVSNEELRHKNDLVEQQKHALENQTEELAVSNEELQRTLVVH